MERDFDDRPVPAALDALLDQARPPRRPATPRARPSWSSRAPAQTARYWDLTLPPSRAGFRLARASSRPGAGDARWPAYVDRYAEPDKAASGLGGDAGAWPVPYWHVDAGMAVQTLLLGAVDAGLGACFFGLFDHERPSMRPLGVPEGWRRRRHRGTGSRSPTTGPLGRRPGPARRGRAPRRLVTPGVVPGALRP